MIYKTYYLEFERYKSKEKCKYKHKKGHSFRVLRVPFWVSTYEAIKEALKEVEETTGNMCYLKRVERVK